MPSLSSNATTYRAGRYSFTGWLSVLPQTVILTGTVSVTPSSYPVLTISYTTVSGSYSNIKTGMTVILKDSGGTQKAMLRVATGGTITNVSLPVNEVAQGVADIQSGDSITVVDEWRIWDKLSAASAALDKDSRIAYSDQGNNPNPVTNSGGAVAGFNTSVTFDGSTSYVIDPDSSSVTHSWALIDGTPSTSSSASPTVTFPVGFRWVSHTTTDNTSSKTTTQRVPVWVHGTGYMPMSVIVESLSGNVDSGWRCTFKIPFGTESSLTSLPDGAMVVYHEREYYANSENSYGSLVSGRSNVKFVGYLVSDSIHIDPDGDDVTFEAVSPLAILEQTPALPQLMVSATSASKWSELKTLTTKKMFWYLANWGSNVLDAFDLVWNDGIDLSYDRIAVEGATIAEQLRDIANGLNLQVTSDRLGRILFTRDPAFLTTVQRASRTTTYALTTADIMEIDMTRQHRYQVKTVRGEGITSTNAPVFSNAPGDAPASLGTGSDTLAKQIVSSQSQLNDRTGYYFAKVNSLYNGLIVPKGVRLKLPMGMDIFDPAYREFVTLTLASDTNARAVAFSTTTKWTVEAVDINYDVELGSKDITITLDHETIGVAGTTYIPPQEGDNGLPDLPDITVDLPVIGFDPGTGLGVDPGAISVGGVTAPSTKTMAAFCSDNKMYLTANFSHPEASGGPTWTATDLTALSGWGGGTLIAFEVDPWSPSYIGTGSTVNGWMLTTTKVQKINDIFGTTPTLSTAISLAYTSSARTLAIDVSVQNFIIVASWYATHGVYAAVTTNGTSWSEAAVTAHENTDSGDIAPGVWISPHTAGKAYISVWTATGDDSTATTSIYKTTNYGSSWSNLTTPTVDSGLDVTSFIGIAFDNAPGNRIYHRMRDGSGLHLIRNSNGTETDITPDVDTITYTPIGLRAREISIPNGDEETLAMIGLAGFLSGGTTYDFTTGKHGWNADTNTAFTPTNLGNYSAGTGFTQQASSGVAFTNNRFTQVVIETTIPSITLSGIEVFYTGLNAGNDADPLGQNPQIIIELDGTPLQITNNVAGSSGTVSWTGTATGSNLKVGLDIGFRDDSTACTGTGTIWKVALTVAGGFGITAALRTQNATATTPTWEVMDSGDSDAFDYRQVIALDGGKYLFYGVNGAIGYGSGSTIDSRIGNISTAGEIVGSAGV